MGSNIEQSFLKFQRFVKFFLKKVKDTLWNPCLILSTRQEKTGMHRNGHTPWVRELGRQKFRMVGVCRRELRNVRGQTVKPE